MIVAKYLPTTTILSDKYCTNRKFVLELCLKAKYIQVFLPIASITGAQSNFLKSLVTRSFISDQAKYTIALKTF